MRSLSLGLWGTLATLALASGADGCGGATLGGPPGGATDGGATSSSGSSGNGSSGTTSSSGSGGGSSSSSSSGASGSSSGSSGSSSGFGSFGGDSGGPGVGSIFLEECQGALCNGRAVGFVASFFSPPPGNPGCTSTSAGACASFSCKSPAPPIGLLAGYPTGVSAGHLVATGGWFGSLGADPGSGSNEYATWKGPSVGFGPGQTLSVTASGDVVPAFGPESVVAPAYVELLQPPIDADGGVATVVTSSDLPVVWGGGASGATMVIEGTTGGTSYFVCTWDASLGQGTIPKTVLQPFAGAGGGSFSFGQSSTTTFSAGTFTITENALPYTMGAVSFQ